jgi:hypothetical protein
MTRRASRIIRYTDRQATVVCPGMGNLWTEEGQRALRGFARLGGYDHCDVASVKLYQRAASDPPETILELTKIIDQTFHQAAVHPRVWNTGTTYAIPLEQPLDGARARNYAVRFFLVGLYARNINLERMYFYNWGGTKIPIVLQADGGAPTPAALAVERAQSWLAGTLSRSCGTGPTINMPDNVWRCQLTVISEGRRYSAAILWTHLGTAIVDAGPDVREVRRVDGSTTPVRPGGLLAVTEEPIFVVDRTDCSASGEAPGSSPC